MKKERLCTICVELDPVSFVLRGVRRNYRLLNNTGKNLYMSLTSSAREAK